MSINDEAKAARDHAELRQISTLECLFSLYKPYYEDLCFELAGTFWAPYSGTRSLEEQKKLYDQGRTPESIARNERRCTNAIPGNSPHNYGCASDWAEWRPEFRGRDIWERAEWPVFEKAVKKVGLKWGGDFKDPVDKPHCELPIKISWKEVGNIYRAYGQEKAIGAIELNVIKKIGEIV